MRTYDPADSILYVHLAQNPAVCAAPAPVQDECHRLPADYANASLRPRNRPALVLLPGGSAVAEGPAAAPELRLAQ
jgi:hypothetical protein